MFCHTFWRYMFSAPSHHFYPYQIHFLHMFPEFILFYILLLKNANIHSIDVTLRDGFPEDLRKTDRSSVISQPISYQKSVPDSIFYVCIETIVGYVCVWVCTSFGCFVIYRCWISEFLHETPKSLRKSSFCHIKSKIKG